MFSNKSRDTEKFNEEIRNTNQQEFEGVEIETSCYKAQNDIPK